MPRRPGLIAPLIALVLFVVGSAAILTGFYRALEIRYTPRADVCAGLDARAITNLTRSPPPVTKPGRTPKSCDFTVGPAGVGLV